MANLDIDISSIYSHYTGLRDAIKDHLRSHNKKK
jgi:hypothetical protein